MIAITREEIVAKIKTDPALSKILAEHDAEEQESLINMVVAISKIFDTWEEAGVALESLKRKNHSAQSLAG